MNELDRAGAEPQEAENLQAFADKSGIPEYAIINAMQHFSKNFSMGIEGNVQAELCPPWPYQIERRCMRMRDGKCLFLTNPAEKVCKACWQHAMERPDMVRLIAAGEHQLKDQRFQKRRAK